MKYKYLIAIAVLFVASYTILHTLPQLNDQGPQGERHPSQVPLPPPRPESFPAETADEMNRLTEEDRQILYERFGEYAEAIMSDPVLKKHCTRATGKEDETCGIFHIRNGDSRFRPETLPKNTAEHLYAKIPRDSQVKVSTACEEDGKFYTRITYTDENGHEKPFKNPFNNSTKCLTSPGLYKDPKHPNFQTSLPKNFSASGHVTKWHIVSENKSYAGAQMAWTLWLNNSGYAYHSEAEGFPATGYPESAGCFRMSDECARGLFFLARRVGTDNMNFHWNGYGHPTEDRSCTRPDSMAPLDIRSDAQKDSAETRKGIEARQESWWRRLWNNITGNRPQPSQSQPAPHPDTAP